MAWPPLSAGNVQYRGSQPAAIAWGTDGIYTAAIVKSIRSSLMLDEIKIEQGSGLTALTVNLKDGTDVEITVVDDRNVAFPDWMTTIALIDPRTATTGQLSSTTTFQVMKNDFSGARKQDGERTISAKLYTLITPA